MSSGTSLPPVERTLTVETLALIAKGVIQPVIFIFADFPSLPRYLWTGRYNYTDGSGQTWVGIGSVVGIQNLTESLDSGSTGIQVKVNGLDPTIRAQIVSDAYQDHTVEITLAFWNSETKTIEMPPEPTWKGTLDSDASDMGPDTISLTINCESRMADILRKRSWKYTDADQQVLHPGLGDTALSKITQIIDMNIPWGKAGSPVLAGTPG